MRFAPKTKYSHDMIKAEIYRRCYEKDINCYLEYHHSEEFSDNKSIFDCVIYRDSVVLLVVEIKNHKQRHIRKKRKRTKQIMKYKSSGVPVEVCKNWNDINRVMNVIEDIYWNTVISSKNFQKEQKESLVTYM